MIFTSLDLNGRREQCPGGRLALTNRSSSVRSIVGVVGLVALFATMRVWTYTRGNLAKFAKVSLELARQSAFAAHHCATITQGLNSEAGGSGFRYSFDVHGQGHTGGKRRCQDRRDLGNQAHARASRLGSASSTCPVPRFSIGDLLSATLNQGLS